LSEYLEQTRTLRARFDQLLLDPAGEVLQRSEGELMIRRPGRFRWEYKSPYEQLIVADGERLWLYEPDLEQVTVRPQDDTLDNTPASLLSGGGDFTAHYRLTDVATTDDGLRAIRLEPRSAGGDFRYLALGFDEGDELKRMELVDRLDQLTRIEFSAVRRGGRLRARLFEFEPPDGVDVIETNGLSPGGVPLSDVPAGQAPVDAPPRR
jgi:outer membrane lipoprotein carrier protein